jgi:hypothetical protein
VVIWKWSTASRDTASRVLLDGQTRELIVGITAEIQWVIIVVIGTIVSVALSLRVVRRGV